MGFAENWMAESESIVYCVVPKCACSSIGQIMYYSGHGRHFGGDIHDCIAGLHKWNQEASQPLIEDAVRNHKTLTFTRVRNPYGRILSSLFDKISGVQRNGKRYRDNLVPQLIQRYGVDVGSPENDFEFDQTSSFRRFRLFARDTIRWRRPMEPDIHWSAMSSHIASFIVNGGRYDQIFFTETFNESMQKVLDSATTSINLDVDDVPKFNESKSLGPQRAHKFSEYFDDLSRHLIWGIYKKDFQLSRYDFDNPNNKLPKHDVDLDEVHARLAKKKSES